MYKGIASAVPFFYKALANPVGFCYNESTKARDARIPCKEAAMPYSIVLLDADNTLFDFTRSEREALTDCLKVRGLPHDRRVLDRYSEINDTHWKMLERGEITREFLKLNRYAVFFKEFGFDCDPASMAKDYMDTLGTKAFLIDGAQEFCESLHGKCRMFIVTNGAIIAQRGRLSRSPITPLFEDIFISEEMGCGKPDRAYFDAVAARIEGYDPSEAIIIGDSLTSDIRGGINAGIATCWYNPTGKPAPENMPIDHIASNYKDILKIILG